MAMLGDGRPRNRVSIAEREKTLFPSPKPRDRLVVSAQPLIPWVQGVLADHDPASNAQAKNEWSYTLTPPYVFVSYTDTL